jgi:hypothetical protein
LELVKQVATREQLDVSEVRVSQRDIREFTGWGQTQLKVHLARLVDRELLVVHRGGPGLRQFYELCYAGEGADGAPFVCGLLQVVGADGPTGRGWSGVSRGLVGGVSAGETEGSSPRHGVQNGVSVDPAPGSAL